jgi:hypothetical protein
MRIAAAALIALIAFAPPASAQMTPLERQRLLAHFDMTTSWLIDEVSNLSQAQLEFRRAPGTWTVMEVVEHLVMVGQIYWDDLRRSVQAPPGARASSNRDVDILWYGIDRTNREIALVSETPKGQLRDLRTALDEYRKQHARFVDYFKTTKDDLRSRYVERQGSDAYQWSLLISTHVQRHILQIREIKADTKFPRK